MTIETWWVYLATVLVFMSTPGPSHLLMISVSMSNGSRRALATAVGDLSANALQMLALGGTYLVIDGLFLASYGKGADWLATKVSAAGAAWVDRIAGAGLIGTALLLALRSNKALQSAD